MLHRFDHKAAHWRDALLQHLAFDQFPCAPKPFVQLIPDAIVGPILDIRIVAALQVESRERRRTHGIKRESPVAIGIYKFMIRRGTLRENSQPSEWVVAFENAQHSVWNAGPADAVKAIAAGDEIAGHLLLTALVPETDLWVLCRHIVDAHVFDFEMQRFPVGKMERHKVLHHLLLTVNRDTLLDESLEINAMQIAVDANVDAPVRHALTAHALANSEINEQIRRPMLDEARANPVFDVVTATVFDDD